MCHADKCVTYYGTKRLYIDTVIVGLAIARCETCSFIDNDGSRAAKFLTH